MFQGTFGDASYGGVSLSDPRRLDTWLTFRQHFDNPPPMPFSTDLGANGDVLQDFDFDSFLHQDGEIGGEPFNFDTSGLDFGDGIGAD